MISLIAIYLFELSLRSNSNGYSLRITQYTLKSRRMDLSMLQ